MGAVLISRSQPKILRKIQKNLWGYIPAIPRFLHVCDNDDDDDAVDDEYDGDGDDYDEDNS